MFQKSVLTEKTIVFTFSILLVLAIWWIFYRSRQKVHVLLYGKSTNPYIKNIVKGITQECENQNMTLNMILFEDITPSNVDAYHAHIRSIEENVIVCRLYTKETLEVIRASQKKCVVLSWSNEVDEEILQADDCVLKVIKPPLYVIEDDALVVVPCTDFIQVDTRGGIVSVENMEGKEIDTIYTIARVYNLKSMYIFGTISGMDQEFVQQTLRGLFNKVKEIAIPGESEGSLAIKEYNSHNSAAINYTSFL